MRAEIKIDNAIFQIDLSTGYSIARTNHVNVDTTSFDLQTHQIEALPWRSKKFIGAINKGGSCNINILKVNPHCAGTHTETILHIVDTPHKHSTHFINAVVPTGLLMTLVLTVATQSPAQANSLQEPYTDHAGPSDQLVTAQALTTALQKQICATTLAAWSNCDRRAVVIRTFDPQQHAPQPFSMGSQSAPYFTSTAIDCLLEHAVDHLLVDFPSIDRLDDGGKLMNHHQFWGLQKSTNTQPTPESYRTITEMISVPPEVSNGGYLLSLQVPSVGTDAMLSRPVLFKLQTPDTE